MRDIFVLNLIQLKRLMYPLDDGRLFMPQSALRRNLLMIIDHCRKYCYNITQTKSLNKILKLVENSKDLEPLFWETLLSFEGLGNIKDK